MHVCVGVGAFPEEYFDLSQPPDVGCPSHESRLAGLTTVHTEGWRLDRYRAGGTEVGKSGIVWWEGFGDKQSRGGEIVRDLHMSTLAYIHLLGEGIDLVSLVMLLLVCLSRERSRWGRGVISDNHDHQSTLG